MPQPLCLPWEIRYFNSQVTTCMQRIQILDLYDSTERINCHVFRPQTSWDSMTTILRVFANNYWVMTHECLVIVRSKIFFWRWIIVSFQAIGSKDHLGKEKGWISLIGDGPMAVRQIESARLRWAIPVTPPGHIFDKLHSMFEIQDITW